MTTPFGASRHFRCECSGSKSNGAPRTTTGSSGQRVDRLSMPRPAGPGGPYHDSLCETYSALRSVPAEAAR
jgi:hypothetical protein